jgi:pimeloyl-ACP methyl ester carboxylesterase
MHLPHKRVVALALTLGSSIAMPAFGADFRPCDDAASAPGLNGSLCARQSVPLSYAGNAAAGEETLSLFIRQFPAPTTSKGTLWLIAGGPGESGASLYDRISVVRRSFPDFDLMLPDHRGTGFSSRLCPSEEAPDSPGGAGLVGAEWGTCFGSLASHAERARQFSITNGARDLAQLIGQRRNGTPTYLYGVSYGTQLILRTLQLSEMPIAGVILDSLVPPQTAGQWDLSQRSQVVDDVGRKVLAQCDAAPACSAMLGEPAAGAYRRLLNRGAQTPALLARVPGADLKRFLGALLDVPAARARIPALIKALANGGGDELDRVMADLTRAQASLGGYSQMRASIPLVSLISASENNLRTELTEQQVKSEEESLLFSSILPELMVKSSLPLYERDQYFGALPRSLPPTLVLSGTLDPKTHYDGALAHVAALRRLGKVGLVSVVDAPHFILWTAPGCFTRHVQAFLAALAPVDQRCQLDAPEP